MIDLCFQQYFLRGLPHLCAHMRQSKKSKIPHLCAHMRQSKKSKKQLNPYQLHLPDLYVISKNHQLPDNYNKYDKNKANDAHMNQTFDEDSLNPRDRHFIPEKVRSSSQDLDFMPEAIPSLNLSSLTQPQKQELFQANEIRIRELEYLLSVRRRLEEKRQAELRRFILDLYRHFRKYSPKHPEK